MQPNEAAYDTAIAQFIGALEALSRGDGAAADGFLRSIDILELERERERQRQHGLTGELLPLCAPEDREKRKTIPTHIKAAVRARDRYRCRYTGRRLIDTDVFKRVSQLSSAFPFHKNHKVKRGPDRLKPPGHPMVRTHGAAYEHTMPLANGGRTLVENVVLTSVELNEAKGTRRLSLVSVPSGNWSGLREFLPRLQDLSTALAARAHDESPPFRGVRHVSPESFDATFTRFWDGLIEEFSAGREIVFTPHQGNPRKVTRITAHLIQLAETTSRGAGSQCKRRELRNDFATLV